VFVIDGFRFDVERIVIDDLLSLLGRHLMTGNVIAIGIVPLKGKTRVPSQV